LQIAIKKMPLNAQNIKLLTSEIHIMKESTHPNVVRYLDSYRVEDKLWVCARCPFTTRASGLSPS
jgi:serine/threonine protein kinase